MTTSESPTTEELLEHVRGWAPLFDFGRLDRAGARLLGQAVLDVAVQDDLPVTVAIFLGEQRVFHVALDGTSAANDDWIRRKRNTVLRHDMSSLEFSLAQSLRSRPDWLAPTEFAVAGGAIPLRVRGALVGVVAVSGLSHSPSADDEVIVRGVRAARERADFRRIVGLDD
jgi:uncharacterized protein (UPF0303 family)